MWCGTARRLLVLLLSVALATGVTVSVVQATGMEMAAVAMATEWKVGNVMSVQVPDGESGYGFNVTTARGKPLVLFAYRTQDAAEAAARQVEAAVEGAVLVRGFA